MSLTFELSPEATQRLQTEAARAGQTPDVFARKVLEERLAESAAPERNRRAVEQLQGWLDEGPDPDEAQDYPETIAPLQLRELKVD